MCKILKISTSLIYYKPVTGDRNDDHLTLRIIDIFKSNRRAFGTRKIKEFLEYEGIVASRRKIGRIMKQEGLISVYTIKQYKSQSSKVNEDEVVNVVNRAFDNRDHLEVIVSDLTYVRVRDKWHYICLIIDLFNREIIGYAAGKHKTADLVYKAFSKINYPLDKFRIFHTDRDNEFKNKTIENILETFDITRSLSAKGNPYDNAVSEAGMKVIKTEFVYQEKFDSLEVLEIKLFDYINWYNNIRIHGSLNYMTPVSYRKQMSL